MAKKMIDRKAKKVINQQDRTVTFEFANGDTLVIGLSALGENMVTRLALHGVAQKVGDSYANAISVDEAIANATEAVDKLRRGDWTTKASGGILAIALARVAGRSIAEAQAVLEKMDKKAKAALGKSDAILTAIAEIRKERATGSVGIDIGALFAGVDSGDSDEDDEDDEE